MVGHRFACKRWITLPQRLNDSAMLKQRRRPLTRVGYCQIAATVEMSLRHLDGAPKPGQPADFANSGMKIIVETDCIVEAAALQRQLVQDEVVLQIVYISLGGGFGRLPDVLDLQGAADQERLVDQFAVDRFHLSSRLSLYFYEVFVGEFLDRFAHERAGAPALTERPYL